MVTRVVLAPKLDTAASAELCKSLQAAKDDDLILEAGAVEMIGALCLELLLSAGVLWTQAGHSISLENPSQPMSDDLGHFGLTPDTLLEYAA